jgi:hypothetical protein
MDKLEKWWKLFIYLGDAFFKWRHEFPPTPPETPADTKQGMDEMIQGPDGIWRKKEPTNEAG